MGHAMVSGGARASAPVTDIMLGDIAEGSIVKLNENGSPVEFYVAKHDYESALNGTGRTLLVRKDGYDRRSWHSSNVNAYASSDINTWLNGTYKSLLDTDVQNAIGTTKFYYTTGNGTNSVTTLSRSIFLLSVTEFDKTDDYANSEGSALPISGLLKIGNDVQWTRTPSINETTHAYLVLSAAGGGGATMYICTTNALSRPCFTLPSETLFDAKTIEFKGVA